MNPTKRQARARRSVQMVFALSCSMSHGLPVEAAGPKDRVLVVATPDGGIQPQAVVYDGDSVHLIYFKGDPAGGDLFYVRTAPGTTEFSKAIQVNSQPGSAVAVGTIRGGQLALGPGGKVHVAWNGSQSASPPNPIKGTPMLYSRPNKDGNAFERQRNLMHKSFYLDGGGSIGADKSGNVFVAWHATSADAQPGEAGRRLWIARSRDDGATFADEEPALADATGACACCGTKALVDRNGSVYVLFRAATRNVERDMMLITSRDHGKHFKATSLQPWPVSTCPMSSESLFDTPAGVIAAWETKGQVAFASVDPKSLAASPPISPPGGGNRKHPSVAANANGETILVWAEDTGWKRGGSLVWRIFDRSGRATREMGRLNDGIPMWGLPSVVALANGKFVIFH
jgi:hypothetical protein